MGFRSAGRNRGDSPGLLGKEEDQQRRDHHNQVGGHQQVVIRVGPCCEVGQSDSEKPRFCASLRLALGEYWWYFARAGQAGQRN
jgi:hypothetical protein